MKNKKLIVEYDVEPCYTLGRNGKVIPASRQARQWIKFLRKRQRCREDGVGNGICLSTTFKRLLFGESIEKRADLHDFRSDFVGIGSGLCWIWIPPKQ